MVLTMRYGGGGMVLTMRYGGGGMVLTMRYGGGGKCKGDTAGSKIKSVIFFHLMMFI